MSREAYWFVAPINLKSINKNHEQIQAETNNYLYYYVLGRDQCVNKADI